MGDIKYIQKEKEDFLIERGLLGKLILEEEVKIVPYALMDLFKIKYFHPARIFWRGVKKKAKKSGAEVVVTEHSLYLFRGEKENICDSRRDINRCYVEGKIRYYKN